MATREDACTAWTDVEALYRPADAAQLLGVSRRALDCWRLTGRGPAFVRISSRCVRYRRCDLADWVRSLRLEREAHTPSAKSAHP
jgi:hypothetical protein